MTRLVLCAVVVLAACSKEKKGEGGGGGAGGGGDTSTRTPEGAIRGFLTAMLARDRAGAEKYLPDEKTCDSFQGDQKNMCVQSVPRLRESLPLLDDDLKDFEIGAIRPSADVPPGAPASVKFYEIAHAKRPDDRFELFVVEGHGEYRVAFPIKMKNPPPDTAPVAPPG